MMKIDDETRRKVLVTPEQLEAMMSGEAPPHIIAVQSVNPYTGADSHGDPVIPGAVEAEAYTDFQAPARADLGNRPLPDITDLQEAARRWGLSADRPVVVYDGDRSMTAARAWWVLRWAGLADVRVLDGGLPAWVSAGKPLAEAPAVKGETNIVLSPGHMPEFGAEEALKIARDGVLLDARIRPNYIGGPETGGDPERGHIPGALSAPTLDTLTDPGHFADSATLRELFSGLGVDGQRQVGVYCGAGMSAAHEVLALAAIGVEAAMYPGSWSQWIYDPSRPVRRGSRP
ncbi:sulfurtransferase [Martelella radicis]|uniref:Thiosulfate/3-mercaptopyruvate sulfurtransferase n=1 Tax=Martelella radicis TaxID=1397476 RepID=A0A7W6PAP6_9HYPH|nr:rhodanese-like domain-containing protein [Martelella radicis]MBB4122591.1 thiosulfate/3-mercaptopyruvate sulfurtransferase [Martelella radicis]